MSREKLIRCIARQYVLDPRLLDRESIQDAITKTDMRGIEPRIEQSEVHGEILRIYHNSRSLAQRLQLTTGPSKTGIVAGVSKAKVAEEAHRQLKRKGREIVPQKKSRKMHKMI